jgi:hypothetical protein
VPPGWDAAQWGAGIVDAEALIQAPLPGQQDLRATEELIRAATAGGPVDRLSRLVDVDPERLETALGRALRRGGADLRHQVARFEGELAYLLLEDVAFRDAVLVSVADHGTAAEEPTPITPPAAASPDLATALHGS